MQPLEIRPASANTSLQLIVSTMLSGLQAFAVASSTQLTGMPGQLVVALPAVPLPPVLLDVPATLFAPAVLAVPLPAVPPLPPLMTAPLPPLFPLSTLSLEHAVVLPKTINTLKDKPTIVLMRYPYLSVDQPTCVGAPSQ
jgi:hypothetical protein